MAAIVSALDMKNSIQYGENNHIEYSWSKVQQEKICQLYFQLVRTDDIQKVKKLKKKFNKMYNDGDKDVKLLMLKIIANTRDIDEGKGEYALSLELLDELMNIDEEVGMEMLKMFIGFKNINKPFGSWKDLKYYMNIRKNNKKDNTDMLINIYVEQMKYETIDENNSLVWKWSPREKSKKFGWIFELIAKKYFSEFGIYEWNINAKNKAKTHLRQLISRKNRLLDTTQIKQCNRRWEEINFNNVTSVTMMKQKNAFLNMRNVDSVDRNECKKNFLNYMDDVKNGKKEMKGKNVGIIDFVRQALHCSSGEEKDIINEQWNSNSKSNKKLGDIIALVDVSGSMENDNMNPLLSAIGLGCRVAEKSKLGKRVLTFTATPSWVNLDDCNNFVDMVNKIRDIPWGMNTNFHKALDLILDTIIELKMEASEVEKLVLGVFSDMQFDVADDGSDSYTKTVREILEKKYKDAGMKICGKPYKVPKIIFWNLRCMDGFPVLSYHDGYAMMSGYSPNALNEFSEEGNLQSFTPWNVMMKTLNKERYNNLSELLE